MTTKEVPRRRWLGGLFGKYVLSFVGLTLLLLLVNSGLETWFLYRETTQVLSRNLAEKADVTSRRIQEFVSEIERQINWATRASSTAIEQRNEDYALLLRQVPAVVQVVQLDAAGKEQLRLTRSRTLVGSDIDYTGNPRYTELRDRVVWLSPVYFDGLEPHLTIAIRHSGRDAGSTAAEINLKFLFNFIEGSQSGSDNAAYILDSSGRLLAHSDSSRRLGADLRDRPQVAAVFKPVTEQLQFGEDLNGRPVLTAAALVSPMNWHVFFEQPLSTALKPVYNLLFRAAWLVVLGVLLAILLGALMARRMVVPIRALQVGAQQLEASDFGHRIDVRTGDEIEDLSDRFNRMADQLQSSYTRLEQKVAERTRDLEQSVSELEALEEIGRAVVSSLDPKSVIATIVTRAVQLTHADAGAIYSYDPSEHAFKLAEAYQFDPAVQDAIRATRIDPDKSILGLSTKQREPINIPDLAAAPNYPLIKIMVAAGFRSALVVPLIGQENILGGLVLQRLAAGEFPPRTVELMRTIAHQSILAIKNARLFGEVEQKSRELAVANEHKARFFATMSHELRTPLNGILGFSELLVDGIYGPLPPPALEVLDRIQKDGKHLLGLINDVLDISKIDADQLKLSLEDYSMESIVQSVVASTEALAQAKAIEVKASMPKDLPVGRGDGRRLTQVLLNIVGNAIKFTDVGSVAVRVNVTNGHFAIAVQDTGPGIAPEDQERIFREFQQVDDSSTRTKGGSGLGLSIAQRLIDVHGGHIDVQSTVGVGTTFNIVLPVRVTEQRSPT